MAITMRRLTLSALVILAGCGQDIDLGGDRSIGAGAPLPPAAPSTKSATSGCLVDDPALLKAPDACPDQDPPSLLSPVVACVVTAGGPVRRPEDHLPVVPACPTGAYFTLKDPFPPENIERAVSAFKGESDFIPAFFPGRGMRIPRTIEVFPDRASFFVRLDPRPGNGRRVDVFLDDSELYRGTPGPMSYGVVFLAGTPDIP